MESANPTSLGCAAGFSQHPNLAVAVGEVVGAVLEGIDPHPGWAMLFVAGPAADRLDEVAGAVRTLLAPEILLATSARGLFGGTQEVAAPSGIALLAADMDGCIPLRLDDDGPEALEGQLPKDTPGGSIAVLLGADGFRFPRLTSLLAEVAPQIDVVGGGVGSGSSAEPSVQLMLGEETYAGGAIGLLMPPGVATVCGLGAVMWDDDGEQVPVVGPVEVVNAAGLVLFAEDQVGLLDGPTLDFDLIFEHMDGALAGISGESFLEPLNRAPDGSPHTGVVLMRPRATALVIRRPDLRRIKPMS